MSWRWQCRQQCHCLQEGGRPQTLVISGVCVLKYTLVSVANFTIGPTFTLLRKNGAKFEIVLEAVFACG